MCNDCSIFCFSSSTWAQYNYRMVAMPETPYVANKAGINVLGCEVDMSLCWFGRADSVCSVDPSIAACLNLFLIALE